MYSRQMVVVRAESEIRTLQDLKGKRIAVQATTKAEDLFLHNIKSDLPHAEQVNCFSSSNELYAALRKNYADAIAGHEAMLGSLIQDGKGAYRMLEESPYKSELGIAFKKGTHEELAEKLPKAQIIQGKGTDQRLLIEEGVESAEAFVTLTNYDEENVMLSLFARTKTKGKIATKINRMEFDQVIRELDLDTTVYPKKITAQNILRFVRAMKNSIGCNVETMYRILDEKAEALEFVVKNNSSLLGIPLEELQIDENTLVACIIRNRKMILPRGKDVMQVGDSVVVVTAMLGIKDISDVIHIREKED